jgi:uncharacterized protein YheU (UPF0270 family)
MIVPYDQLQPETLDAMIEEFVTRDGTVQGHADAPVAQQIDAVKRLLVSGRVVVLFDEETEACTIATKDQKTRPALESLYESEGEGGVD